MSTYKGKASMSWEDTWESWKEECVKGTLRVAIAFTQNVSIDTVYRMYKHYGLPSPKSKEGKEYVKKLSILQGCTPDRVCMPEKAFTEKE